MLFADLLLSFLLALLLGGADSFSGDRGSGMDPNG